MIRLGIRRALQLALRRRDRWEREVEDEIRLHLALRAEQLAAEGRTPDEAYQEALRRFGPLNESRARLYDAARSREERMQRTEYFGDLAQDLSYAFRTIRRQKAWTAVTVATLALGIGATTAVFSVVSTILLHRLPYPNSDRVVYVYQQPATGNKTGISVTIAPSATVLRAWIKDAHSFESMQGSQVGERKMKTTGDEPTPVVVEAVLPSFAAFTGVKPVVGRMFSDADIESRSNVVVLSETFWRNRLGSNRAVLGQRLTLGDSLYTIVGVMPASMSAPKGNRRPEMWTPLDLHNDEQAMGVIARLRRGASIAAAEAELDSVFARSGGFTNGTKLPFHAHVATPAETVYFRDSLNLLAGAVALVLLVACANVAHLLLARGATRQREMAIRTALGAGQSRLLRQLLTESLLLSSLGTAFGVLVGWASLKLMIGLRPQSLDMLKFAHLDLMTLEIAVAVAAVSGIVFALMGTFHSARASAHDTLKSGSPSSAGVRRARGRGLLVISEMALSALLLVGATLLVRSVSGMQHADLGFDPHGLYAITVPLDSPFFKSDVERTQFMADYMRRLRAMPAVRSASVSAISPGGRWFSIGRLEIEGEPAPTSTGTSFIDVNNVERSYFSTLGITLREGTTFTDTSAAANQVIVNEGFARKHWKGSALGRRLRIAGGQDPVPWLTIVGVVRDAQTGGPSLAEVTAPLLYTPRTNSGGHPKVLVRVNGDAATLAPAIDMLRLAGMKKVSPIEDVSRVIASSISAPKFVMLLLTIFTLLALLLAAVGLYGMMAYTVAERTREIGIRVALGASSRRIARSVVGTAALLAAVGAVIGLAAAAWGTRVIETQLYGVTRLDPVSYAIGAIVLVGVALVASIVPTRRALSVDPMTAIRAE